MDDRYMLDMHATWEGSSGIVQIDIVVIFLRINEIVDGHVTILIVLLMTVLTAGRWRLLLLRRFAIDALKQCSNATLMVRVTIVGMSMGVLGEVEGCIVGVRQGSKGKRDQKLLKTLLFFPGLALHPLYDIMIFLHELLVLYEEMSTHLF